MNHQRQFEYIQQFPSGLRTGELARGQLFCKSPRSIKKIGSSQDINDHLDYSITPIQKSFEKRDQKYKEMDEKDFREQLIQLGDLDYEFLKQQSKQSKSSTPQIKSSIQLNNKDALIEENAHSIILNDDEYQQGKIVPYSQSGIHPLESKDECIDQPNKIQQLRKQSAASPSDDMLNQNINIIGMGSGGITDREITIQTSQRRDNVIRPLGANPKYNSELQSQMQRSITVKKKQGESLNKTWKSQGLFVLFYIRKFIVYLKNISQDHKFRSLNRKQFKMINDKANNFDYYKYGNYLASSKPSYVDRFLFSTSQRINKSVVLNTRLLSSINEYLMKNIIIINPESPFKLIWDGFMLFLLVINIFYIPLKIAFEDSSGLQWPSVLVFFLNDVPGWAFLMDILLNFNTAYYKKGVVITNRVAIFKYYIKNQFFWDLFVLIPFIISQYFEIKYLDAILLLRFSKILKITNNYLDLLNLRNDQAAICDLIKLIILILFIAHFCGCAFYLVSYIEVQLGVETNWLKVVMKSDNVHNQDWFQNYITSFYWAVITMITVGYGDITPCTTQERIFAIVICLLSCGVFAYSVNAIGSIIGALTQKATNFKQKMALLSIHMKKRGLSTELQMKVKKYFEYLNDEKLEDNQQGENMLKELAGSLKHQIALDIYGKILNSKKLFKLNFSSEFLTDLAPKLKERRLGPEEIIYNEDEQQPKIYFVMKGNVDLFMNIKKSSSQQFTTLETVSKGGVFGELGFFSGMLSNHGAITTNVVSLVYISIEDFQEVIKQHPIDHEKYTLIKDNYILYSSSRGLGSQCWGCGKFTHQINHCPLLNYVPNKDQIIQKYKKLDQEQKRTVMKRERYKSSSPWLISDSLKQAVVELIVEREQITDLEDLYARIEEMEQSDEELKSDDDHQNEDDDNHGSDSDQNNNNNNNNHLKDHSSQNNNMNNNKNLLTVSPSDNHQNSSDAELLNRIIRKGNRQKTYRKNSHTLQSKPSFGINLDKQINNSLLKKSTEENLQESMGLLQNNSDHQQNQYTKTNSFKDLRSTIKRATFMKKMSTRKTGKDFVADDDNIMLYPDGERRKKKNQKGLSKKTLGGNGNSNLFNSVNPQPLIDPQALIEKEKNTRLYSKVLELDCPKDFLKYYPKNNPTTIILKYNAALKQDKKESSIANNSLNDPSKKKFINIKNMKGRNSILVTQKFNGLQNITPSSSSSRVLKKQVGNITFTGAQENNKQIKNPSKFKIESSSQNKEIN